MWLRRINAVSRTHDFTSLGNEYCGPENVIRFARDLCIGYNDDPNITFLINNRETWLYLMVNPDGRENVIRYNNNGVDLNRDWGYMWDGWGSSTGAYSQVESKALRACMYGNQYVVHSTYHGGIEYILRIRCWKWNMLL